MEAQQIKKIFRTYQGFIIAIAILLVSIIGFVVGVIPFGQKVFSLALEVSSLSDGVQLLQHKVSVLDSLDEETLKKDLLILTSAVPPDKSLTTLLGTIDGITSKTGVSLDDVSLANPGSLATDSAKKLTKAEAALGSNVLSFVITVRGTYDQIRAFLATIVSVRRFLRILSVDISFGNTGEVIARADMQSFYYPFPQTVGSVNQVVSALGDTEEQTIQRVASMELAGTQNISFDIQASPSANGAIGSKVDPFSN